MKYIPIVKIYSFEICFKMPISLNLKVFFNQVNFTSVQVNIKNVWRSIKPDI